MRRWLAVTLLKIIRSYFVGRDVYWMTRLDGQPLVRGQGKVISGRIDYTDDRMPIGMTLFWSMPGRPIYEIQRFKLSSLERDKTLGWCIYDR